MQNVGLSLIFLVSILMGVWVSGCNEFAPKIFTFHSRYKLTSKFHQWGAGGGFKI